MSLHHRRPEDARERECPRCAHTGSESHRFTDSAGNRTHFQTRCPACSGTGRLPAREADVEIDRPDNRRWRYRKPGGARGQGFGGWSHDTFPTESAALAAAREAARQSTED